MLGLTQVAASATQQRLTVGETMFGLMQQHPLLLSSVIQYAARWHGDAEVVSRMDETTVHRTNYAGIERRSHRLAKVLLGLGVRPGDRVATLAWNHYRHLELYWAISEADPKRFRNNCMSHFSVLRESDPSSMKKVA